MAMIERQRMKYRLKLFALAALVGLMTEASAQPLSFLTEQQKVASYCAGVSEARIRELGDFIKNQCASSTRKDCLSASDDLVRAQTLDRRLWDYLKADVYAYKTTGERQKMLSQEAMARGGDDWLSCKRRRPGQAPEELSSCREVQACLAPQRLSFLPP
jgi:hypothetical protein